MPSWTHLIHFVAAEDHQIHLGQLVDTTRDIGLDTFGGKTIKAYEINGTIFSGEITKTQLTVLQVSHHIIRTSGISINNLQSSFSHQ